jgi:hypothetical protein
VARRRYISTNISLDRVVNEIAMEPGGDFVALLYTWMIPHAEENASITGDPKELKWTVIPGRDDRKATDVEAALSVLHERKLIAWDSEKATVYFDSDSFYRYQSNVQMDKRVDNSEQFKRLHSEPTAANSKEQQQSAANSTSFSLSPTPSPTPKEKEGAADAAFSAFWSIWPNKHGNKRIAHDRFCALPVEKQRQVYAAARHFAAALKDGRYPSEIQMRAENFIGGTKRYYEEWQDGPPAKYARKIGNSDGHYAPVVTYPVCGSCGKKMDRCECESFVPVPA